MAKFQKGQSGNPAGRPKGEKMLTPIIRRALDLKLEGHTKTLGEEIAATLLATAASGDIQAIRTVLERVDGKVLEEVDVTSGGEAVTFGFDFKGRNAEDR